MTIRTITAALCCLALLPAAAFAQEDGGTRLSVEGRGEVASAPDIAVVSVGVSREAQDAAAALEAMSDAAAAVLERVLAEGIAARDVQTGQLDLSPRWEGGMDGEPRLSGYVAATRLDLRVRDLDRLGALISAAVSEGANELQGLSFALSEPREAEDSARRAAWTDAMAKAALYAEAGGLEVGPVLSASEVVRGGAPRPMAAMARAEMADVPIAEGEVSTEVTLVMEILLVAPDGE